MASEFFNAVGGLTVGIPAVAVVDANGNVVTNILTSGNVAANVIYSDHYRFANGAPFVNPAGGSTTQLQYNNGGALGGIPNVTYSGNILSLGSVSNLSIGGGLNGYFLQTDGNGVLSWAAGGGGGGNGSPGGANTQVQFNDAGSFGGDSGFTYNKNTNILSVTNANVSTLVVGNANATGNISATYFIGNGSLLTGLTTDLANYVIQPNQANITSLGNLTFLNIDGNTTSLGNINTSGNISAGNINVSSNIAAGNATITNKLTAQI
jgi:hypothetical protein